MQNHHEFVEGIRIQSKPAPLGKRLVAIAIDLGIVTTIMYGVFFVALLPFYVSIMAAAAIAKANAGASVVVLVAMIIVGVVVLLAIMSVAHVYFIFFEFKKGATPGKKILGLRVISADGGPITKGQAIYRDFVRWYIDFLFILPAIVSLSVSKKRQRVGDLLANTLVVHSEVAESRQHYMYVDRENFLALSDHLHPAVVSADIREKYLVFANRVFLMGESLPEEQRNWVGWIRRHLERSEELGLNDYTVLRFFAELCFQEERSLTSGEEKRDVSQRR